MYYKHAQSCVCIHKSNYVYKCTHNGICKVQSDEDPWRIIIYSVEMCTREEKKCGWPNHWTMNLVSVAFAGPFITLNTVILGTLERLGYKQQTYCSSAPCLTKNRSLILPPAKSPSALPAQQNNKKLHNPIHSQANLDCNTLWQFVFDKGTYLLDALQLFSAATIVSWINTFNGAQRYFSVFPNYILPAFYIISQLMKPVVHCYSQEEMVQYTGLKRKAGVSVRYELFMCVCPKDQKTFPAIPQ